MHMCIYIIHMLTLFFPMESKLSNIYRLTTVHTYNCVQYQTERCAVVKGAI